MQDIPVNTKTVIVTYSDASWSNAAHSGSQIGIMIGLCPPEVRSMPTSFTPIDWRSCRAALVCRSTLAAEASAADEASDRAAYVNMTLSEILFLMARLIDWDAEWTTPRPQTPNRCMTPFAARHQTSRTSARFATCGRSRRQWTSRGCTGSLRTASSLMG